MINITVAYATVTRQLEIALQISESTTIAVAIQRSGIIEQFPEIKLSEAKIGVFSRRAQLDDLLHDGDRIEIYRPLIIDPKQARLLRAKKVQQKS